MISTACYAIKFKFRVIAELMMIKEDHLLSWGATSFGPFKHVTHLAHRPYELPHYTLNIPPFLTQTHASQFVQ
jgi:hypothetical protein